MRTLAIALTALTLTTTAQAQKLNFSSVLNAETADAELYLKNYINPFMQGFGYGLASGWYNTAAPHARGRFDFSLTGTMAFVPNKDIFFEFAGFQTLTSDSNADLPTVFGSDAGQTLTFSNTKPVTYTHPSTQESITEQRTLSGQFAAPDGLDLEGEIGDAMVPVPMAQLGVGIPQKTDVLIRWMPGVETDDFSITMWGIGAKHDIKQWIPAIRHLPFSASVLLGYTALSAETNLTGVGTGLAGSDQVASYDINLLTFQLLASKRLSALTVYSGLGMNSFDSTLKMTGTYIVEGTVPVEGQAVPATATLVDPIDLSFVSSSPRWTLGARFKLLALTLHADYTLQEYNTLTFGLGLNF